MSSIATVRLRQGMQYSDLTTKFQFFFSSQYKLEKLPRKLENWYELKFGEFIKELNKSIKANNKLLEKAAKEAGFQAVLVDILTKKMNLSGCLF